MALPRTIKGLVLEDGKGIVSKTPEVFGNWFKVLCRRMVRAFMLVTSERSDGYHLPAEG